MSFAEWEYLPFLLVVLGAFQFVPRRARALFLLAASYAFYAWWSALHCLLLLASTAVDYGVGLALHATQNRRRRKLLLLLSIAVNLALLAVFKYGGFAAENLNRLLDVTGGGPIPWRELVLPLGISFYTFQTLSYSIDVYRRTIEPCRNPIDYALYVSFFPQLVAGPIERAGHLIPQLRRLELLSPGNFSLGARRILWGLLKKTVVSDRLIAFAMPVVRDPGAHDPVTLYTAATTMVAVLYLDFSAYTDIARGSARLFGVELVPNFDRPFLRRESSEFWTRWHLSLIHI